MDRAVSSWFRSLSGEMASALVMYRKATWLARNGRVVWQSGAAENLLFLAQIVESGQEFGAARRIGVAAHRLD